MSPPLRVHLGCERRFNIEFYGADSLLSLLTPRVFTWSSGRPTRQPASRISVVAHISGGVTNVSSSFIGIELMTVVIVRRDEACSLFGLRPYRALTPWEESI